MRHALTASSPRRKEGVRWIAVVKWALLVGPNLILSGEMSWRESFGSPNEKHGRLVLRGHASFHPMLSSRNEFRVAVTWPKSQPVGSIPPASNSHPETQPPRTSTMICRLTEGVRRGHFATSSRSAPAVQTSCRHPVGQSSQVQPQKGVLEQAVAGAIPAAFDNRISTRWVPLTRSLPRVALQAGTDLPS